MYKTMRYHDGSLDYWNQRWCQAEVDSKDLSLENYPGLYADSVISLKGGPVLEAGCGLGRIFFKYYRKIDITAFDFSEVCINKIKSYVPDAPVYQADILSLPFEDNTFNTVLAFGLYHNFEAISVIETALSETRRVMKFGGVLCASFRLDSIVNRLNDYFARKKNFSRDKKAVFHKLNLSSNEFEEIVVRSGYKVFKREFTENMPLLYKLKFFRGDFHKIFNENKGRKEGYQLSPLGMFLNKIIKFVLGKQSSNLVVLYCEKI